VALDYQLARDIEMVDIGPQWIYDRADMIVYVLCVVDKLMTQKQRTSKRQLRARRAINSLRR
jgi:hypothetical protein